MDGTPQPFTRYRFENLSDDERIQVREYFNVQNWGGIVEIYERRNVSPDPFLPCCWMDRVITWTQYAIEKDLI